MTRARPPRAAPLRIRRAVPGDERSQAAIMRAAVLAEAGRYPPRALAAWASLPALYHRWAMTAGGELRFVAERAGRAVGFAGLRGTEVTALFVRPSAAGRGVGRALLRRVEAEALRRGVGRLHMVAARAVVPFYAALGFERGLPADSPLPGGLALPAMRMSKRPRAGRPRERPTSAAAPRGSEPPRSGRA